MDFKRYVIAVCAASCALPLAAQNVVAIPNGTSATAGGLTLQVTALRDDVLRVTEGRDGQMPEDSSWAVLPASRTARAPVQATADGFTTKSLRVAIDNSLQLTVLDLQGHVLQQDAHPLHYDGRNFRVSKQMALNEHFFGLGDKVGPLDRRGMAFVDWNTDIGWQESTDPIYKSIPFFYSWREGRVLGVLFDNTWRASFDFGKQQEAEYSFGSTDGPVTYYLMYGPGPKAVVEDYAWLTGTTPMPPLWSLGYQQSRFSYSPESSVRDIASHLRADHFPADAIYLDIDYQQKYRPFTVDRDRFPTFEKMVSDLKAQDFRVVAITDLHIAHLPGAGYTPYDQGTAEDRFVKLPGGAQFIGSVWPGAAVFPEFTSADTRAWWGRLYTQFSNDGIAGFWNDMNEPSVFESPGKYQLDSVQHTIRGNGAEGFKDRVASHLEIHNVFGMLNTEGTYQGLRTLHPNERPFVLTRASYAGGQRYAATWTGDNSSTWNHLRLTTPMLENLGLSGFAMAGADVGGFLGSPQMDLLTKWFEIGAFQTIDRDHTVKGSHDQEPWVGGPEREAIRRRFVETRYHLMPYLYTAAEEMARTGIPLVRPLFLEFPNVAPDGHPMDLDAPSEFMFGPSLLVAPPEYPDETDDYSVLLPPGIWYDFWTGLKVGGSAYEKTNETLLPEITPAIDTLPVYARGGSVIPQQPLVQSTAIKPQGPLTLHVFPGPPDAQGNVCAGEVYLDDGISYNFQRGDFLRMTAKCTANAGTLTISIGAHQGKFAPWWHSLQIEVHGWQGAAAPVAMAGRRKLQVQKRSSTDAWEIVVPDSGKGETIALQ